MKGITKMKQYQKIFNPDVNEHRLADNRDLTRHHEITDRLSYLYGEMEVYHPRHMFRTQKDVDELKDLGREYKRVHHFAEEWEIDVASIDEQARELLKLAGQTIEMKVGGVE